MIGNKSNGNIRIPFILESIAMAVIPFEEVLTLPIGSVLRFINLLVIFFCLMESCKIRIHKSRFLPIRSMLFFFTYVIISFFWCFNRTFYIDRLSTYGLYVILIILLCSMKPSLEEKKRMLDGLFVGGVLAAIMVVFSNSAMNIGGRETLVIFGRMIDPNILAYSCVLSLVIILYKVIIEKKYKFINIILSILLFISIIICGSRGAFVVCISMIILIFMNIDINKKNLVNKLLTVFVLIIIIVAIYIEFVLTSKFGARFTIDNLIGTGNMGMANRDRIWHAAFVQILNRPIFGYGNGASMYAIAEVYKFYGTHNTYILLLLEFGIVGFILFSIWQFKLYKICSNNNIYKILFISLMIFVMFVEGLSTKVFWGVQIILMTFCYGEVSN